MLTNTKKQIELLLKLADITLNGPHPWDIQVHDERFYERVLKDHHLGLGESYMDGWWDCLAIDEFINKVFKAKLDEKLKRSPKLLFDLFLHRIFNFQTIENSKKSIEKHYDIGNDLYIEMLDKTLTYTCAYWEKAQTLEQAQRDKMELICRKLRLEPGMKLLDLGCGWGGFAKYAAENYQVEVLGVTISTEQQKLAEEKCRGLPIKIKLLDYRHVPQEKFDRVTGIGNFEHVGYKNHRLFMEIVHSRLKDNGLALLQTIGSNTSKVKANAWIDKYIFPKGALPSIAQIGKAIEGLFIMEDWHNFGLDYDKTLMAWHHNFNKGWPRLKDHYDERFFRMWNYYLLSCAGMFRARAGQLWQIVLSKEGLQDRFKRNLL